MGNKPKFGDSHLSKPYQSGQFCNFIDDAIVSHPGCPLLPNCDKNIKFVVTSQLNHSANP